MNLCSGRNLPFGFHHSAAIAEKRSTSRGSRWSFAVLRPWRGLLRQKEVGRRREKVKQAMAVVRSAPHSGAGANACNGSTVTRTDRIEPARALMTPCRAVSGDSHERNQGPCSRCCGSRPTRSAVDAIERLVAEAPDHQLVPHQSRSPSPPSTASTRRRRRRLPACRADRHLRHLLERALPGLRRRARLQRHAEDRPEGRIYLRALRRRLRADARRDGRGDLHGQPAGAQDRGAQSRRAAARPNISARSTGVPASTCRRNYEALVDDFVLDHVELRRAKRQCSRCSCRPSSSSSSSR